MRNSILSNKSFIDKLSLVMLSLTLVMFFVKIAGNEAILTKNI